MEDKGRVRNYSLFRMMRTEDSRFIIWNWIRKSFWESEPHLQGTTEFITVFAGSLEVRTGDRVFDVKQGEKYPVSRGQDSFLQKYRTEMTVSPYDFIQSMRWRKKT